MTSKKILQTVTVLFVIIIILSTFSSYFKIYPLGSVNGEIIRETVYVLSVLLICFTFFLSTLSFILFKNKESFWVMFAVGLTIAIVISIHTGSFLSDSLFDFQRLKDTIF